MMKNTTEKFSVPVRALFPADVTISPECLKNCQEIDSLKENEKAYKAGVEKIRHELNDTACRIMDGLSVNLPTDPVEIQVSVGSLLLDLYVKANQPPTAPIAQSLYQSKIREFAENFQKDDIVLTDEVKNIAKNTLLESNLWDTLNITGCIESNGQKRYLPLNNTIISRIPKVFSEIMGIYSTEEVRPTETTSPKTGNSGIENSKNKNNSSNHVK